MTKTMRSSSSFIFRSQLLVAAAASFVVCLVSSCGGGGSVFVESFVTTSRRGLSSTARRSGFDSTRSGSTRLFYKGNTLSDVQKEQAKLYPEKFPATYELGNSNPFEFGSASFVRPLLKQTQLEKRKLRVAYDANKHGYDAKIFHQKVDGQGASVVLARVGFTWFGGYNPRGWASLGGSRPSVASFLFYKTLFGWQKLRVNRNGGLAISKDEFDQGIYFGAEGLVIPLYGTGSQARSVASRLGTFHEIGPGGKTTLLPVRGAEAKLDELQILVGVYDKDEGIPNSGGVTDLGLY